MHHVTLDERLKSAGGAAGRGSASAAGEIALKRFVDLLDHLRADRAQHQDGLADPFEPLDLLLFAVPFRPDAVQHDFPRRPGDNEPRLLRTRRRHQNLLGRTLGVERPRQPPNPGAAALQARTKAMSDAWNTGVTSDIRPKAGMRLVPGRLGLGGIGLYQH